MDFAWTLIGQLSEGSQSRQISVLPSMRVGRGADATLCIPRPTVSTVHAELTIRDNTFFVRDVNSTNGTYVNGSRIVEETQLHDEDLVSFADVPFRVSCVHTQTDSRTIAENVCDRALALVQFDRLLSQRLVVPHFQPIVTLKDQEAIGYEVLGRSRVVGLETPLEMFSAAAQLNLEAQLSNMLRVEGIRTSCQFPVVPHVFVNTHPAETDAKEFMIAMRALRSIAPCQPITVEIHEQAITNHEAMAEIRELFDELDLKLAFDDFGAGQARLAELAEVRPHYVKFDRCIISNIHSADSKRRRLLEGLLQMTGDLGVTTVAEGIELKEEGEVCAELGFDLAQGFYFGRPAPVRQYCEAEIGDTDIPVKML